MLAEGRGWKVHWGVLAINMPLLQTPLQGEPEPAFEYILLLSGREDNRLETMLSI